METKGGMSETEKMLAKRHIRNNWQMPLLSISLCAPNITLHLFVHNNRNDFKNGLHSTYKLVLICIYAQCS